MADIGIEITVTGAQELARLLGQEVPDAIQGGIADALQELRDEIDQTTTSLCPVRTGALRASIDITATDTDLTAVAGMDYASYVDLGTRKMDAEPFFTEPIQEAFDNFLQTLEEKLQSSLQNL